MGEVYRAVDTRLGRAIAIKITREQFSERFEREAHAISALNHANICTLHDVGPNYLVMELVEGETLAARLKNGPLPIQTVLLYGSQIAAALMEAHGKGIIHRDLKPGNIMIGKSAAEVPQELGAVRPVSRGAYVGAAAAILALAAATGYFFLHRPPKLTAKDTIVLAEFENKTPDPVFDQTLRQGLAVQLQESPFL